MDSSRSQATCAESLRSSSGNWRATLHKNPWRDSDGICGIMFCTISRVILSIS